MKRVVRLLILFLFMFFVSTVVYADTFKYGFVNSGDGSGLNVRKGPGTSYDSAGDGLRDGTQVKILDEVKPTDGSKGCNNWYKIVYLKSSNQTGYVCKDYIKLIDIEVSKDFEKQLEKFPKSYHDGLKVMHSIFPNAIFKPYNTRLNFNSVVKNEATLGKSLIWDSYPNGTRDGLKHLGSYNSETNTFANNFPGGGKNWYAASEETIAYYLDPRNFFEENRIFMFESLSYTPSAHTVDGVQSILKGSFMEKEKVDKKDKTFAQIIMEAGSSSNISPYYLASRILQETGYSRSALVKGTYPSYPQFNGYYNFFNYGAGGSDVIKNGLQFAFDKGWNSEEKAIKGGTNLIGTSYINSGQDTNYFQKWDVVCNKENINSCNLYSHQYMQNIEAPYNEAYYTFKGYKGIFKEKVYSIPYIFNIPIYESMPDKVYFPSKKNPIDYLSSITIDNKPLPNFNSYETEYKIELPLGKKEINVNATTVSNTTKIEGLGKINILKNEQIINIKAIAENGNSRTYKIKVILNDENKISLEETLKNVKLGNIKDNYITGLTNVDVIKQAFLDANSLANVIVKNTQGKEIKSGNLGTGYTVTIEVNDESKIFDIVIYGDTNGDTEIDILDLLRVQKYILKDNNLSKSQVLASDISKDGIVDILDLLKIQKHLLGDAIIKQ